LEFDNSFDVAAPVEQTWAILKDIERIAPCLPGAELTEVIDEDNYKGKVSVRLGPVALTFQGQVTFTERNDADYTAKVKAQGAARPPSTSTRICSFPVRSRNMAGASA
jgi:hypothetical protein